MSADHPPLVVLTGGIASGKSTASRQFTNLGITVIDTDALAREVVAAGQPALDEIARKLGSQFIDQNGQLNRAALRQHVFANPDARKQLEQITHPRIRELAMKRARQVISPYGLLVVPLYVESGQAYPAWKVLVVDVPESVQLQRLMQRDRLDEKQARSMLAAQASRDQRLAVADHVLDNSNSPQHLIQQCRQVHERLLKELPQSG